MLELGTASAQRRLHGGGAGGNGAGRLTTVDSANAAHAPARGNLARAGLAGRVELVREFSSYTWWLKEQIAARTDAAATARRGSTSCYLDGAKNWTIDGLAVFLVERLLRPGGWLLMDDLDWTYAQDPGREATDGVVHRELSEPERTEPHLRAVLDLLVAQHPSFTDVRVQDEWWGWARKAPGEPRRYTVEASRPLGAVVSGRAAQGAPKGARRCTPAAGHTASCS